MPSLNANGHVIHYVETGGGSPTLVLVHGAGGSHATWTRQLEDLADAARVIAVDLPGHGTSGGDGCRAVGDYAAIVRAFLETLGPEPVVLGGHSMGGAITQTLALVPPANLRGIVLVGTGARLRVFPKLLDLLAKDHAEGVDFLNAHAWSPSADPALPAAGRRALLETRAPVTLADFTACDRFDVMAEVARIRLPALVIAGEDDRLTPLKYAEYLVGQIPGARLARIARAGHYIPLEEPDEVNRAIREFLAGL